MVLYDRKHNREQYVSSKTHISFRQNGNNHWPYYRVNKRKSHRSYKEILSVL